MLKALEGIALRALEFRNEILGMDEQAKLAINEISETDTVGKIEHELKEFSTTLRNTAKAVSPDLTNSPRKSQYLPLIGALRSIFQHYGLQVNAEPSKPFVQTFSLTLKGMGYAVPKKPHEVVRKALKKLSSTQVP